MNRTVLTLMLLGISMAVSAQNVIENPSFKGTTANYVKILKIELHDTATVIGFEVHFKPNWWIQVPKETWIQDSRGGEKLYVKSASGIEIDERHTTPKNGINEYTLYFPPVGEDVKSIDFMEVKWKIFGYFSKVKGVNSVTEDGSNEWMYGFFDELVVYDSEIWKQVLINSEGDTYQVLLQKDGKRKRLFVKQQDDKLLIGPNESGLELFSRELTSNPDYAIPNDEAFQLPVFKKDTAWYKGYIKGFDRIVFKGSLRPIAYAIGMQAFLKSQGVLNKNYKEWVTAQSTKIIEAAHEYSQKTCGRDIIYIPSCNVRKEELAHEQQIKSGIKEGLIGVWSCVESCDTFRSTFDASAGYPQLHPKKSRCKHLYFYFDHADYGFMSIRLQTWAPYNIQVNGIGPGYFITDMTRPLAEDKDFDSWLRNRTPSRRWGYPEELIGTLIFLCSQGSDYVNGQIIYVDGGIMAVI